MKQNTDLVIAHYKESLDWLIELDHENLRYIWLYSKSKDLFYGHEINKKIIHQYYPNYGTDPLTFLNHVVKHYDHLNENVIFMQANLNPHIRVNNDWCTTTCNATKTKEFIDWLQYNDYTNNYQLTEMFECLSLDGTTGGCDPWFITGKCKHLQDCLFGSPQPNCKVNMKGHIAIPQYLVDIYMSKHTLYEWVKLTYNINLDLYPPRVAIPIFWGCIIGLKSQIIKTRPVSFYRDIIDNYFIPGKDHINNEHGHFIERSTYFLYNLHEWDQHKFSIR